jgi:hypothetical protein
VGPDIEIVIEGYPRTGNTFAVIAFQQAQARPVRVAHHVHVPAQLIAAARRGIPAIALIRPPEDAVLSFAVRLHHISVAQALRSYVRFYEPLVPHATRLVVADLAEVAADFGAVIARVNDRFGTAFAPFVASEENMRRVFDEIDRWDRGAFGDGEPLERSRARPSPGREEQKEPLRPAYGSPSLEAWRRRADRVYTTLVGGRPEARRDGRGRKRGT